MKFESDEFCSKQECSVRRCNCTNRLHKEMRAFYPFTSENAAEHFPTFHRSLDL